MEREEMSLVKRNRVRSLLMGALVVGLTVFVGKESYGATAAQEVSQTCALVQETTEAMETLQGERGKFLKWLNKLRKMATKLQAQPAGPARDYRLRTVMAEARELSRKMSLLDKRLQGYKKKAKELTKKIHGIARQLKNDPNATLKKKLQKCFVHARGMASSKSRKNVGKLSNVSLDPRDGPREIRRKANLLSDSADKLEKRLRKLERSIKYLKRQVDLRHAVRKADGRERLWGDDSRRRVAVRVNKSPGVKGVVQDKVDDSDPNSLFGGVTGQDGNNYNNGTDTIEGAVVPASGTGRASSTPSVSLQRVWNTTVKAIRDIMGTAVAKRMNKAFLKGDRVARLKALRRAQKLLEKNAKELREKSKKYRKKARSIENRTRSRKSR